MPSLPSSWLVFWSLLFVLSLGVIVWGVVVRWGG
jgi:hypothetical protein